MPTSVLLAVLAATGLFVLAPALVRRYDATERLAAERTSSTARVLSRRRRRRTVPGRVPVNPPHRPTATTPAARPHGSLPSPSRPARTIPAGTPAWRRARRRRILAVLTVLSGAQVAGVFVVGPGFWAGFTLSAVLLATYVVVLRKNVRNEHRRRAARATAMAARRRRPARPTLRPVPRLTAPPPPVAPTSEPPEADPQPPPRAANM